MSINKISDTELSQQKRFHADQDDVPGKSAQDMKVFMDYVPRNVIIPKVNEVIETLENDTYRKEDTYNKTEAESQLAGKLALTGGNMNGDIDMGGHAVKNAAAPQSDGDAVNKQYVDSQLDKKPNADGSYPKMSVGFAETAEKIESGTPYISDAVFNCRVTADGAAPGEICDAVIKSVIGNSTVADSKLHCSLPTELTVTGLNQYDKSTHKAYVIKNKTYCITDTAAVLKYADGKKISHDTGRFTPNKTGEITVTDEENPDTMMIYLKNPGYSDNSYQPYSLQVISTGAQSCFPSGMYSTPDVGDEIDYAAQKAYKRVEKIALDGTEQYLPESDSENDYNTYAVVLSGSGLAKGKPGSKITCTHFDGSAEYGYSQGAGNVGVAPSGLYIIFATDITSLSLWKQYVAQQAAAGTPVTVCYQLDTPVETAINIPVPEYTAHVHGSEMWKNAPQAGSDTRAVTAYSSELRNKLITLPDNMELNKRLDKKLNVDSPQVSGTLSFSRLTNNSDKSDFVEIKVHTSSGDRMFSLKPFCEGGYIERLETGGDLEVKLGSNVEVASVPRVVCTNSNRYPDGIFVAGGWGPESMGVSLGANYNVGGFIKLWCETMGKHQYIFIKNGELTIADNPE